MVFRCKIRRIFRGYQDPQVPEQHPNCRVVAVTFLTPGVLRYPNAGTSTVNFGRTKVLLVQVPVSSIVPIVLCSTRSTVSYIHTSCRSTI